MKTYKMPNMGAFRSVESITSNSGNDVPNQFIIHFEKGIVFQSYNSIIAVLHNIKGAYLGKDWNYSCTTSKYRNGFLNENTAETRKGLKNGEYKMLNI